MSRAPWVAHFGLTRTPFGKAIAAKDLFARDAHAEAVARISFCVMESALGVITGDVGAGKTVAVRAAVAGLDPTRHQVIYIANPAFGTRGLYVTIVRALGAEPRFHKAEVMAQAATLLAAEEAERHRRVLIVVDEAHLLDPAQLEELRLLTNAEMDSASPFAGILVGQPMLNCRPSRNSLALPSRNSLVRRAVHVYSMVSPSCSSVTAEPGLPTVPGDQPRPSSWDLAWPRSSSELTVWPQRSHRCSILQLSGRSPRGVGGSFMTTVRRVKDVMPRHRRRGR